MKTERLVPVDSLVCQLVQHLRLLRSLDPTFGNGGTTMSEAIYEPRALALQADGKLVVAGDNGGSDQFQLARFNGDGTLDSGFGSGGVTSAGFDSAHPSGMVVTVAPDPSGRLVAMGSAYYEQSVKGHNYSSELALARFDPSGSLDPAWLAGYRVPPISPK